MVEREGEENAEVAEGAKFRKKKKAEAELVLNAKVAKAAKKS